MSTIGDGTLAMTLGRDARATRLAPADRRRHGGLRERSRATTAGGITRKVETVGGVRTTCDYAYDDDGRLLRVDRDGDAVEDYTYDADGNRTSRRVGAGAAETLRYDGQDRLDTRGGADVYDFDADGFLARRGADTFDYSARGELLQATTPSATVTYDYDGLGRRVSRTQGGATTEYLYGNPADAFQVTAVRAPSGELSEYCYDEDGLLFAMERGGVRYSIATDQVGTPRVVTDATGAVVKAIDYDSFGVPLSDTAPAFDLPFGFAGGLSDPVTGLVRFGLRDYEPETGRWTARDPLLFDGGQANLYVYAGGDPVGQRDPTGLLCVGGSVYAGFGGGGAGLHHRRGRLAVRRGGPRLRHRRRRRAWATSRRRDVRDRQGLGEARPDRGRVRRRARLHRLPERRQADDQDPARRPQRGRLQAAGPRRRRRDQRARLPAQERQGDRAGQGRRQGLRQADVLGRGREWSRGARRAVPRA